MNPLASRAPRACRAPCVLRALSVFATVLALAAPQDDAGAAADPVPVATRSAAGDAPGAGMQPAGSGAAGVSTPSAGSRASLSAPVVVDSGDDDAMWTAIASPGATAEIVRGGGKKDGAVGLAFDLGLGREHAIARRALSLELPSNYMFVFTLRGQCEPNTLEIKFVSGENVWWHRLVDYEFPRDWKDVRVSTPRLEFAWGPAGGGLPARLDAIEIAVAAGKGGKGEVWIDEIRVEPRRADAERPAPTVSTSSNPADAPLLLDADESTVWRSAIGQSPVEITLDFHEAVEQGGLEIAHAEGGFADAYTVETSVDAVRWDEVWRFTRSDGGIDPVFMPDVFARYVRLRFEPPAGRSVAIGQIRPQPFDFSSSRNSFFASIARRAPAGMYPRYFAGEQSYWTVVGVPRGSTEALVSQEGSVEVDAGAFTLEPFLFDAGRLHAWKDADTSVSLEDGDLPVPTVLRRYGHLSLQVTAFAAGDPDAATLYVRYRVHTGRAPSPVRLFVALRPFQVLPPWQTLNRTGGVAFVSRIDREGDTIHVDQRRVVALTAPDAFGAAAFEQGDVTAFLAEGRVPDSAAVADPFSHASAALAWDLEPAPGRVSDVWIALPWSPRSPVVASRDAGARAGADEASAGKAGGDEGGGEKASGAKRDGEGPDAAQASGGEAGALLDEVLAQWRALLDRPAISLPEPVRDLERSLRSNLAYVLINADAAAIQPGSRTYERSWIRDGAMTSGALLELGFDDEVKDFLRWFAGYIRADGWVPCCVDARGADPVPEHDSFGEFIWAVAEVWRFTRDEAFVRELWPRVRDVAACMSRLRARRMTPQYEGKAEFGLLPESISHEGYSARPVHSYWDQAFALRGFADAAMLASVAGDDADAKRLRAERDDFEKALRDSIAATMKRASMDVVPASVELADFDPTSTAVSFLLGTDGVYPADALRRSFDRYVAEMRVRRGRSDPGVGYTAYELRSATVLVLLGLKAEAVELLQTLVGDQRPPEWNQWPEISWLSSTQPSFLGDLPHSWIGSTYMHAIRTLLVTERDARTAGDGQASLLVGAGVPLSWLDGGGVVHGHALPTWFGALTLDIRRAVAPADAPSEAAGAVVELEDGSARRKERAWGTARSFAMPDGGIEVAAPFGADVESAAVDGVAVPVKEGAVVVRRLPATVVFEYKSPRENRP